MIWQRWKSLLLSCGSNADGGAAMIFAITLVPLVLAAGAALDYGNASAARTQLDRAADAAALEGARAAAGADRKSIADATFKNLAASVRTAQISGVTVSTTRNTVKVEYAATVATRLMALAGKRSMTIANAAEATSDQTQYADYYLLVDTSASMGTGATPADTQKLINKTGCALACHQVGVKAGNGFGDSYSIARAAGINTRIDVARTSVVSMIKSLQSSQTQSGQFRIGIYTFNKRMKPLVPLTSNLGAALNGAQDLILDPMLDANISPGGTNVETALQQLNALLPRDGDGSAPGNARKFVLLVTDGLNDNRDYRPYDKSWHSDAVPVQSRIYPFNPGACDPIKVKGVELGVLDLTYVPVSGPTFWPEQDNYAKSMAGSLHAPLRRCASEASLYFPATYSPEIASAFQRYLHTTLQPTRFTQ